MDSVRSGDYLNFYFILRGGLTNSFSTKNCTVLLLCISLLISCYMFRLKCHYLGADTYIAKSYD